MPRRTGAIPLIATTVDGRPIKLEGNPLHPASGGATDTFAQASILDLYDPARSKRFVRNGKASNRAAFETYLADLRKTMLAQKGDGLAFLVEETHSPTRERLRAELEKMFPRLRWVVYEPLLSEAQSFATELSFGGNLRLVPRLERADVILALDSDFLDCGQGDIASVRAFSSRRRVRSATREPPLCGRNVSHSRARWRTIVSAVRRAKSAFAWRRRENGQATKTPTSGSVIGTLKAPAGCNFRPAMVERSRQ
jgi:hypothetical protein